MLEESTALPELQVLGTDARRAVGAARAEAQGLGHVRIGTEHLLLGVLRDEGGDATRVLQAAGAGRAAVWSKVREARPPSTATSDAPEEATPRAARALRRSVRFSHRRHTNEVTAEDLLLGVLDVEGTAGQVLRSLGVDLDDLRVELLGREATSPPAATTVTPCCPSCTTDLAEGIAHQRLRSAGPSDLTEVLVHLCPGCGAVLGITPA